MIQKDPGLYACSLFLSLDDAVIAEILSGSQSKDYPIGAVLIEKGKVPDALYIIRKGKVGIYNEDILLAQLEPYSIMGESFLADASATATTVTLTDVSTIEIKREQFYNLSVKHPKLVFNIFYINFQFLIN